MDGLLPIKHGMYICTCVYRVGLHGFSIAMFQYQSVWSYLMENQRKQQRKIIEHYLCTFKIHMLFYPICMLIIFFELKSMIAWFSILPLCLCNIDCEVGILVRSATWGSRSILFACQPFKNPRNPNPQSKTKNQDHYTPQRVGKMRPVCWVLHGLAFLFQSFVVLVPCFSMFPHVVVHLCTESKKS